MCLLHWSKEGLHCLSHCTDPCPADAVQWLDRGACTQGQEAVLSGHLPDAGRLWPGQNRRPPALWRHDEQAPYEHLRPAAVPQAGRAVGQEKVGSSHRFVSVGVQRDAMISILWASPTCSSTSGRQCCWPRECQCLSSLCSCSRCGEMSWSASCERLRPAAVPQAGSAVGQEKVGTCHRSVAVWGAERCHDQHLPCEHRPPPAAPQSD